MKGQDLFHVTRNKSLGRAFEGILVDAFKNLDLKEKIEQYICLQFRFGFLCNNMSSLNHSCFSDFRFSHTFSAV